VIIEVIHFKEGADRLVSVPLGASDKKAILLETDFDDLMALGVSPRWKLYHGQVMARNGGRDFAIGRLIRHATKGERVDTKDGDPTNLRRSNLVLTPGQSHYSARDMVLGKSHKNKIQIEHIGKE
jgi:hypothetical protein